MAYLLPAIAVLPYIDAGFDPAEPDNTNPNPKPKFSPNIESQRNSNHDNPCPAAPRPAHRRRLFTAMPTVSATATGSTSSGHAGHQRPRHASLVHGYDGGVGGPW